MNRAKKAKQQVKKKITVNGGPFYSPDPSPPIVNFLRPVKRFNILPDTSFHTLISLYADMLPVSLLKRHAYIETHFPMSSPIAGIPLFSVPTPPIHTGWSKEKSVAIRRAEARIMKFRFAFKRLLHMMRFRRLQRANEEDLVTGEVPKHLVQIVSWVEKRVYTFEAYTLMKDITERLLHHDGFFEEPQVPRNPFTNIPFTESQTISVWNSLSRAGIPVSSAFTLFRTSRYDMKKFKKENSIFLKLNTLRRTFREVRSYDYRERLMDFISYCYDVETIECETASFKYIIYYYPEHPLIKRWSALCERYYEPDILFSGNSQIIHTLKEEVLDDTYEILHLQREIISFNTTVLDI
jgi:hypothetical protein